jgi:hypothetical protein
MLDHTTNPNVRKTPLDLVIRLLRTLGGKIFQADDRYARDRGWQITSSRSGLSRTYRDPRFDSLTIVLKRAPGAQQAKGEQERGARL